MELQMKKQELKLQLSLGISLDSLFNHNIISK